jgi:hypothetical protein
MKLKVVESCSIHAVGYISKTRELENEEVTCDVLRQSPRPIRHARLYNSHNFVGKLS